MVPANKYIKAGVKKPLRRLLCCTAVPSFLHESTNTLLQQASPFLSAHLQQLYPGTSYEHNARLLSFIILKYRIILFSLPHE